MRDRTLDRFRHDPRQPPPDSGFWLAIGAIAIIVAVVWFAHHASGAESKLPTIWIYQAEWCGPCKALKRDVKAGKLPGFVVVFLPAKGEMTIPCIAWWGADKRARYHEGWGPGDDKVFLEAWRVSMLPNGRKGEP